MKSSFKKQHKIVYITNKRIFICEMDPLTGRLTASQFEVDLNAVKHISLRKGLLKTKVSIIFSDDSAIQLKPNNFCLGLSNDKKYLLKLEELYASAG